MPAPHPMMVHVFHGEPRHGVWCPKCLLPSGFEIDLFTVSLSGVRPFGTVARCWDCGRPIELGKGEQHV